MLKSKIFSCMIVSSLIISSPLFAHKKEHRSVKAVFGTLSLVGAVVLGVGTWKEYCDAENNGFAGLGALFDNTWKRWFNRYGTAIGLGSGATALAIIGTVLLAKACKSSKYKHKEKSSEVDYHQTA